MATRKGTTTAAMSDVEHQQYQHQQQQHHSILFWVVIVGVAILFLGLASFGIYEAVRWEKDRRHHEELIHHLVSATKVSAGATSPLSSSANAGHYASGTAAAAVDRQVVHATFGVVDSSGDGVESKTLSKETSGAHAESLAAQALLAKQKEQKIVYRRTPAEEEAIAHVSELKRRDGDNIMAPSCRNEFWDLHNRFPREFLLDPDYNNDPQLVPSKNIEETSSWRDRIPRTDSQAAYVSKNGESHAMPKTFQKDVFGCTNTTMANFNPTSTRQCASCCMQRVYGCADPSASNYDPRTNVSMPQMCRYPVRRVGCVDPSNPAFSPESTISDASKCAPSRWGCVDPFAPNFDPLATMPGYCKTIEIGCKDHNAENYNPEATIGKMTNCIFAGTQKGCTNPYASNWNPNATEDDGSCVRRGCADPRALNYDMNVGLEPSDNPFAGCVYAADTTGPSERYIRADEYFAPRDSPIPPSGCKKEQV